MMLRNSGVLHMYCCDEQNVELDLFASVGESYKSSAAGS